VTTTFVDSTSLYAFLDGADRFNARAVEHWRALLGTDDLVTHNYVLIETSALLQARIGTKPVRALHDEIVPALTVHWVDRTLHEQAVHAVTATDRRVVSLVDRTSFILMRRLGVTRAFAFDPHFAEEGFEVVG
jgi:uncharacterized protein